MEQNASSAQPVGIILANTGSPAAPTPEAVRAYLAEFLMDDRIIQMPRPLWKTLLNRVILPKRQYASAQKYASVWTPEGSPQIVIETRLAEKLESALRSSGYDAYVRIGMSYGPHPLAEACEDLKAIGCKELVVLPAYPQSGYCITGSVHDAFERARKSNFTGMPARFVEEYGSRPAYRKAIAESIREAGFDAAAGDRILFSFHSIPLKDVRNGDSYLEQIDRSVQDIAMQLQVPADAWSVGYSCVFGPHPEKWAGPLSRDLLRTWGNAMAQGQIAGRIFFATPGFSVDCLETLWDIPQELEPVFVQAGGDAQRFVTVPPLNDSEKAVAVMADAVFPTA
ncbi:MAG: ferrochelatase [Eggerthellaceae bacterium]|jgi:ferrochelatase